MCWCPNQANYAIFPNAEQIAPIQLAYHRALFESFKDEMSLKLTQKRPKLSLCIENFGLPLPVPET